MRSHFRMTSRDTLSRAMARLASLGCVAETARGDELLLIVIHDDSMEEQVRRVVEDIDPTARQAYPPEAC